MLLTALRLENIVSPWPRRGWHQAGGKHKAGTHREIATTFCLASGAVSDFIGYVLSNARLQNETGDYKGELVHTLTLMQQTNYLAILSQEVFCHGLRVVSIEQDRQRADDGKLTAAETSATGGAPMPTMTGCAIGTAMLCSY